MGSTVDYEVEITPSNLDLITDRLDLIADRLLDILEALKKLD